MVSDGEERGDRTLEEVFLDSRKRHPGFAGSKTYVCAAIDADRRRCVSVCGSEEGLIEILRFAAVKLSLGGHARLSACIERDSEARASVAEDMGRTPVDAGG